VTTGSKSGRVNRYYSHVLDPKGKSRARHSFNAARVEEQVYDMAARLIVEPQVIARLASEQVKVSERDKLLIRLDTVNSQLAKVPAQRQYALDYAVEQLLDRDVLKRQLQAIDDRKARLESERDSLNATLGEQAVDDASAKEVTAVLTRWRGKVLVRTRIKGSTCDKLIDPVAAIRALVPDMPRADLSALIKRVNLRKVGSEVVCTFEGLVMQPPARIPVGSKSSSGTR